MSNFSIHTHKRESLEISKSNPPRFEGCRPPRNANKGSMDRLFDVDGHGPKKSRILDQPDEKIQFEIFDKLSWPQLLTNFYEILTSCLPS